MSQTMDPNNMPFLSEASVSVEIETEDMTLNIGPQHPSTHGVLRLVAKVNGEKYLVLNLFLDTCTEVMKSLQRSELIHK